MSDRLIVDDGYNWVDTATDTVVGIDDLIDLVNELHRKNVRLQDRIDELEDDNTKYSLGEDKPVLKTPRFQITHCPTEIKDTNTNRYYWLELNDMLNENHDWIDTEIDEIGEMDEVFGLINELHRRNIKFR